MPLLYPNVVFGYGVYMSLERFGDRGDPDKSYARNLPLERRNPEASRCENRCSVIRCLSGRKIMRRGGIVALFSAFRCQSVITQSSHLEFVMVFPEFQIHS
jgi:hypothetical protein